MGSAMLTIFFLVAWAYDGVRIKPGSWTWTFYFVMTIEAILILPRLYVSVKHLIIWGIE